MKFNLFNFLLVYLFSTTLMLSQMKSGVGSKDSTKVEITTNLGKIIVSLSNSTPLHRDNFLKLVKENKYDSILFHRVIQNFMVQAGESAKVDADSLNSDELLPKIPAEINPQLFHKRGALAAARDGNPERASSPTQFYIVQGKIFNDSLINIAEGRINGWLGEYYTLKDPANKRWQDSLEDALEKEDFEAYTRINDTIKILAQEYAFEKYQIPSQHREVYKTIGGAAHLDQNYTVFGEVISGMEVIDTIAAKEVGESDKPKMDILILSMKILED